jgi:hypothetical protein
MVSEKRQDERLQSILIGQLDLFNIDIFLDLVEVAIVIG